MAEPLATPLPLHLPTRFLTSLFSFPNTLPLTSLPHLFSRSPTPPSSQHFPKPLTTFHLSRTPTHFLTLLLPSPLTSSHTQLNALTHIFPSPPHSNALPHTFPLTSLHTPTHFPAPLPTFSLTSFYLPPHPNTLPTPLLTLSPHTSHTLTFFHTPIHYTALISLHTSPYLSPISLHLPQHPNTLFHSYSSAEKLLLPPPALCYTIYYDPLYFNRHLCAVNYFNCYTVHLFTLKWRHLNVEVAPPQR